MSYNEEQFRMAVRFIEGLPGRLRELEDANERTMALIRNHGVGWNSPTVEDAVRQLITAWELKKELDQ